MFRQLIGLFVLGTLLVSQGQADSPRGRGSRGGSGGNWSSGLGFSIGGPRPGISRRCRKCAASR